MLERMFNAPMASPPSPLLLLLLLLPLQLPLLLRCICC